MHLKILVKVIVLMFSNKAQLKKRTPQNGTDRENYLSLLVDEYLNSTAFDAKCQVLANLANFAYDPINYGYIRDVGVLDIFLYVVKNETNEKLLHYACAGISNLCLDPLNVQYILGQGILNQLSALLKSDHEETIANILTILLYLYDKQKQSQIINQELVEEINKLKHSNNNIIVNLATIFLDDVNN